MMAVRQFHFAFSDSGIKGGWREWGSVRRGKIQREGCMWLGEEDGDVVQLGIKQVDLGEEGTELNKKG